MDQVPRRLEIRENFLSHVLLPYSIYKKLELEALTPTRMTLELANRSISHPMGIAKDVVVRVDGFTFLADFVVKFCSAIAVFDFRKRSFSAVPLRFFLIVISDETSDNLEVRHELAPLDSLPPGNDDSTIKKDLHEDFQVYSNPLFEFDDNFKSSNVNPLFEENDKDVEIKSSFSFTLTSPEESEFEAYLERDLIPPRIDLTLPPLTQLWGRSETKS
ncbi:hypothetical protein Tco_0625779 [Tanacetum coccineum]|uniref:Uncharacterized protein n=1 Tax=Tanacetum coccineum TaxID=301880 RepID=A0ABQ4WHY4_9ASTR